MMDYESEHKVFYKVKDLKERWEKEGVTEGKKNQKTIKGKIESCFCKIGLSEQLDYYKTRTPNEKRRELLFKGDSAPDVILHLFWICDKWDGVMTRDEAKELGDGLAEIIPVCWEREAVRKINKMDKKFLNLTNEYMKDKGMLEYAVSILADRVRRQVDDFYFMTDKNKIFEERFFVSANDIYYGKEGKGVEGQKGFFTKEFRWVQKWKNRWSTIMDFTETMRRVERFGNIHDECMKRGIESLVEKEFYEKGKSENEELKKIIENSNWMNSKYFCEEILNLKGKDKLEENSNEQKEIEKIKTCLEECKKLVDAIINHNLKETCEEDYSNGKKEIEKIKTCLEECKKLVDAIIKHNLKETCEEDYRYMLEKAFEDLEDVYFRINLEKNRSRYKSCFEKGKIEELNDFMLIRAAVYNRKMNVIDFMEDREI